MKDDRDLARIRLLCNVLHYTDIPSHVSFQCFNFSEISEISLVSERNYMMNSIICTGDVLHHHSPTNLSFNQKTQQAPHTQQNRMYRPCPPTQLTPTTPPPCPHTDCTLRIHYVDLKSSKCLRKSSRKNVFKNAALQRHVLSL